MSLVVLALIVGVANLNLTLFPDRVAFHPGGLIVWATLLVGQFKLTRALLTGLELLPTERSWTGLWPMIGLGLLSEVGIMMGFGFLIVPGLILWGRWLLGGPILLVEGGGIISALSASWVETFANVWLLVQAFFVLFAPFFAFLTLDIAVTPPEAESPLLSAVGNFLAYAGAVASWIVAVAAYRMSGRARPQGRIG